MLANNYKEKFYAVFPLQTVLFPGCQISLRIFEQRYLRMIKESMRDDKPFVISLIKGQGSEVGMQNECHHIACLTRVVDFDQGDGGVLNIVARAGSRVDLSNMYYEQPDNLLCAELDSFSESELIDLPDNYSSMKSILSSVQAQSNHAFTEHIDSLSATEISFYLSHFAPISSIKKQKLLELQNTEQRLEALSGIFSNTRFTLLA
jgi:Lon protease-like protein